MVNGAFSAGVEPGGLYDSQEIKILVCYMLMSAGEPMPRDTVLEIVAGGGMANLFETGAAIDELIRQQNVIEQADGTLRLTDTGHQAAATLSSRIPYTLRDRSVKAALQSLTRIRRERENTVDIQPLTHGTAVTCTIRDADFPLLSLTLRVADSLQAARLREQFLADPALLYRSVMAVLTGDARMTRADTQIVIDLPDAHGRRES